MKLTIKGHIIAGASFLLLGLTGTIEGFSAGPSLALLRRASPLDLYRGDGSLDDPSPSVGKGSDPAQLWRTLNVVVDKQEQFQRSLLQARIHYEQHAKTIQDDLLARYYMYRHHTQQGFTGWKS